MCYSNYIYNYSTKSIIDDNWHKVLIIFSINNLCIYVDNNLVLSRNLYINTYGYDCYIGQSNHKGFYRPYIGYLRNFIVMSGIAELSDINTIINSHIN